MGTLAHGGGLSSVVDGRRSGSATTYNPPMSEPPETTRQLLERLLKEGGARPKVFGPHFDRLVAVIEEEVNVAFAMGNFGKEQPVPDLQRVHAAAVMIADGVDDAFRIEPKAPDLDT